MTLNVYLSVILKSKCCQNYVCHFCVKDIYVRNKANLDKPTFCSFCNTIKPSYQDVTPDETVKYYTDSPFSKVE